MRIAFNPSTVEALITPPDNKDITFDLRGRNIFARGVKFQGTDTNTWRDIKINNVSIGSHTLDLRNGSNTTLTNTNGVVTINSTWRPVVDNLTSDSTTSSLSAKQGKVLKSLIDGKSNSGHTHDDRYLKLTGGTMASNALITFADSGSWGTDKGPQGARGGLYWSGQSDYAKLYAEETAGDNLDLVIQFGDDNSNGLSIRNASNVQTSYISAGGVITTKTFKGNLDWSYITNKPATATRWPSWGEVTGKPGTFTPSAHEHNYILDIGNNTHITFAYSKAGLTAQATEWLAVWNGYELRAIHKNQLAGMHTHAWNSLTHSSTTANQAILTNGSANGWKLYTLNISAWDNAASKAHSHSNKSVLDGITSGLVNNWNTAYNFVNNITGTDTDKVINKWEEIVNFLAGITEDNKLNTLLNSKLSVYELANNTNVGAIKNNGIYYSTTDASSGTLTNSPFNTGFALINMTSYDGGDDLRRSRLAFNAYGEIKVSNDRDQANTAETWYNVLTSKNSGINGSTIKLNGTSITVYSSGTADGRYVKKSGDTMTGALNFANGTWNKVGDDSYMGDCNVGGHFGIRAANTTYPGIAFFNNANAHLGNLTAYNGNIKYGAYSLRFLDNGNTSVSASTWTNPFSSYNSNAVADGQAICVWGQSSSLSNLAADSGDMSLWLKRVNAKTATLNMVLDGEYYANGNQRLAHVSEIPTSLKNPYALTISLNGTSQGPYDGSAAKNINITPSSIGAATSGHNHDGRYVYNYGGTQMDGASINKNALGMSTTSGITGDWWHILQAAWNGEYRWNSQIAFPTQNRNGMYYRSGLDDNTAWGAWVKLLDVNNYSSTLDSRYYTESESDSRFVNITGDTMTGTLTLANSSVTSGTDTTELFRIYSNTSYKNGLSIFSIDNKTYINAKPYGSGTANALYLRTYNSGVINALTLAANGNATFIGSVTAPSFIGNASSATKLQTPRTIWGQSFNGTANVDNTLRIRQTTGNYCEGIRIQNGDNTWATIILGATADSGTNTNAWSIHRKSDNNFAISRNSSDGVNGLVMTSTGMGLGTTAPAYRLDVNGDIWCRGALRVGSSATNNYIAFYGTTGDTPGSFGTSFIGEHLWGNNESSELLLMKFNDVGNGTSGTTVSGPGPDRIRHIAHAHVFQIMTDTSQGDFATMAATTAVETKLDITRNRITASVPLYLQSDLHINGTLQFHVAEAHIGHDSGYSDPWGGLSANFKFGGVLAATHIYSNGGFHKNGGTSQQLLRADGGVATFNWSGQSGQPTWLWGGNNQHSYYVYNPSNFRVAYATSAGNADKLDGYHASKFPYINNSGVWKVYGNSTAAALADNTAGLSSWAFGESRNSGITYLGILKPSTATCGISAHGTIAVFGQGDTHLGIASDYSSANLQVFGGNADKIVWRKKVAFTSDIPTVTNYYWANVKISASSSTTTSPTVHTLTATRVCAGHNPEIDNSISCSNWFRSSGATGWYNTTYQGGWYMSDTSWIRAHNNVGIYTGGQIYSSSSIRMGNILLEHTDEINSDSGLGLNQRSPGNVSLCQGGGKVGIGTIYPSHKLHVMGNTFTKGFGIIPYYLSDSNILPTISPGDGYTYRCLEIGKSAVVSCIIADRVALSNERGVLIKFNAGFDGQIVLLKDLQNYGNGNGYFWVMPSGCAIIRPDGSSNQVTGNQISNAYDDGKSRFFVYSSKHSRWIEFYCG